LTKKVVLIVQARMGSSRLPGKSMLDLAGAPLIVRVLERVKRSRNIDTIVLAIPDTSENDVLELEAKKLNINCFRGSEDDLLDRYYQAAKLYNADIVGRIPADNPLSEPDEIDRIIEHHKSLNAPGFSSNLAQVNKSCYPDGIGAEMFDFSLLKKAWELETNQRRREHVHLNFYDYESNTVVNSKSCPVSYAECPEDIKRPDIVLDVNTVEQYYFIKEIYDYFYISNPFFNIRDIIYWYDNSYKKK
jgi:spore coat polysaccharide biosynthesis protein SpsF